MGEGWDGGEIATASTALPSMPTPVNALTGEGQSLPSWERGMMVNFTSAHPNGNVSKKGAVIDDRPLVLFNPRLSVNDGYSNSVVRSTPCSCALPIVLHGVSTTQ